MRYLLSFLVLTLFLSSCEGIVTTEIEPGKEFDLKLGDKAVLAGADFSLIFKDVTEDSRCPEDVVCFWEGNAGIQFWSTQANLFTINSNIDPKTTELDGYILKLIRLSPYPSTKKPIKKEDYTVTLLLAER